MEPEKSNYVEIPTPAWLRTRGALTTLTKVRIPSDPVHRLLFRAVSPDKYLVFRHHCYLFVIHYRRLISIAFVLMMLLAVVWFLTAPEARMPDDFKTAFSGPNIITNALRSIATQSPASEIMQTLPERNLGRRLIPTDISHGYFNTSWTRGRTAAVMITDLAQAFHREFGPGECGCSLFFGIGEVAVSLPRKIGSEQILISPVVTSPSLPPMSFYKWPVVEAISHLLPYPPEQGSFPRSAYIKYLRQDGSEQETCFYADDVACVYYCLEATERIRMNSGGSAN